LHARIISEMKALASVQAHVRAADVKPQSGSRN